MIDTKILQSVTERDIDMLLIEECQASELFRQWLAAKVFSETKYKQKIGAWHSICETALGESDIIFIFENETGGASAILIENKISASAQPDQGNRYQKRGAVGQERGWWEDYKTCLVAPAKYLQSVMQTEIYDVEIAYEDMISYFRDLLGEDERFEHKALVIEEGILQNRRGYQPEVDNALTQFAEEYFAFAHARHPELGMDIPKPRPAGSTWMLFHPDGFPENVYVAHQMTAGFVKLFFRGAAKQFDSLQEQYAAIIPGNAQIELASKSVAITMEVPKISDPWKKPFVEYVAEVDVALKAISELAKTIGTGE